jgi:septum formation protein
LPHAVLPQYIDESVYAGEMAATYVQRMARQKAESALQDKTRIAALPILAADTSVVCEGQILGKPANQEEAVRMLSLLSGRKHQVLTAIAVVNANDIEVVLSTTQVSFRALAQAEIVAYWQSGEPSDKAGAYAIQGRGAMFVNGIEGSYSSVVGLPLFETLQLLNKFGLSSTDILQGDCL